MKKIISIMLSVLLVSVMLIGCGAKKEEVFETFNSESGAFSVDFIEQPQEQHQSVETEVGNIDVTIYMVEKEDIAYVCSFNEFPQALIDASTPDDILVNSANGAVANAGGSNQVITDITLGEYPGKEVIFEIENPEAKIQVHQKIYLVGNKLYQLVVTTENLEEKKVSVDRLFESFKLTNI